MLLTLEVPTQCARDSSALWLLVLMPVDALHDKQYATHMSCCILLGRIQAAPSVHE